MKKASLLISLLSLGICINPSAAQNIQNIKLPLAIQSSTSVNAKAASIISAQDVATSSQLKNAALSNFVFNFNNGDHSINTIQVLQKNGVAEVEFADQDENDPYWFSALWIKNPAFSVAEIGRATADPATTLTIPNVPAGYTVALAGFSLNRPKSHDGNLRGVKIWIENNSQIKVYYETGHGANVGRNIGLPPSSDYNGLFRDSDSYVRKNNDELGSFLRQNNRNFSDTWPYYVRVQYALIPDSMIESRANVSGSGRAIESGSPPTAGKQIILTGFSFDFLNDNHHILQIGVDLKPNRTQESIFFQDNNRDDPIAWKASYITLK